MTDSVQISSHMRVGRGVSFKFVWACCCSGKPLVVKVCCMGLPSQAWGQSCTLVHLIAYILCGVLCADNNNFHLTCLTVTFLPLHFRMCRTVMEVAAIMLLHFVTVRTYLLLAVTATFLVNFYGRIIVGSSTVGRPYSPKNTLYGPCPKL